MSKGEEMRSNKIRQVIVSIAIITVVLPLLALEYSDTTNQNNVSNVIREQYEIFEYMQPDGTKIKLEFVLGGRNNPLIMLRINGFTVVYDYESKFFCWARQANDGTLESTKYPVHLHDPETIGLEKDIRMSDEATKLEIERIRKFNPLEKGKL